MGGKKPEAERCGAKTKRGTYCRSHPLTGAKRCRLHGGIQQQPSHQPHNIKTGQHTVGTRFARISEDAQRAIDEAMRDPHLLDVRQGIALMRVQLTEAPLVPDDDLVEAMARRQKASALQGLTISDPDVYEQLTNPSDADLQLARVAFLERALPLADRFTRRTVDAMRQIEVGRMLHDSVVPMFNEMGLRLSRLVEQYVPEKDRASFRASFRQECHQVVANLYAMKASS